MSHPNAFKPLLIDTHTLRVIQARSGLSCMEFAKAIGKSVGAYYLLRCRGVKDEALAERIMRVSPKDTLAT